MKLLEAINRGLPKLQAPPLSGLGSLHPMGARLKAAIEDALLDMLSRGYWFNQQYLTLYPDTAGQIGTPAGMLALYPQNSSELVEARGEYLYSITNSSNVFPEPLSVALTLELPFEELPYYAANVCAVRGLYEVYCSRFDASDASANTILRSLNEAQALLEREHLRKRRFSAAKYSSAAQAIHSALRS